jgi:hypothetical protein
MFLLKFRDHSQDVHIFVGLPEKHQPIIGVVFIVLLLQALATK